MSNGTRRGNGRCLDNDPAPRPELDFQAVSRLPGEQYSPDLQCQLALGTQYKAYFSPKEPFNDACRELWCLSGSWATPAHPGEFYSTTNQVLYLTRALSLCPSQFLYHFLFTIDTVQHDCPWCSMKKALEGSPCGENGAKCYQGSCSLARDSRGAIDRRRARMRPADNNNNNNNNNNHNNHRNIVRRPNAGVNNRLKVSLGLAPIGNGIFNRRRGARGDETFSPSSDESIISSAAQTSPATDRTISQKAGDFWSSFVHNAKSLFQRLLLL